MTKFHQPDGCASVRNLYLEMAREAIGDVLREEVQCVRIGGGLEADGTLVLSVTTPLNDRPRAATLTWDSRRLVVIVAIGDETREFSEEEEGDVVVDQEVRSWLLNLI